MRRGEIGILMVAMLIAGSGANATTMRQPTRQAAAPGSIVEWDIRGNLQKLDHRPEVAALDLLDLDPLTRSTTRTILDQRHEQLRHLVTSHTTSVVALLDAAHTGDDTLSRHCTDLRHLLHPDGEPPQLVDELARVMAGDDARHLRAHVRDYWRAVLQDARLAPAPSEEYMAARDAAFAREQDRLLVVELMHVMDDIADSLARDRDALLSPLQLDEEARAALDAILDEPAEEPLTTTRRDQRRRQVVRILTALDDEKAAMLAAAALEHARARPATGD